MESAYNSLKKWVDYDRLNTSKIIIPSLIFFSTAITVSAISNSILFKISISGVYTAFIPFLTTVFFCFFYTKNKQLFKLKKYLYVFFILCFAITLSISFKVKLRSQVHHPDYLRDNTFYVKNISEFRNSKLVILKSKNSKFQCSAYFPRNFSINKCDIISGTFLFEKNSKNNPFERKLIMQGIHYKAKFNLYQIEKSAFRPLTEIEKVRNYLFNKCSIMFNNRSEGIAKALIFGNKSFLSQYTLYCYKRAGVLALVCASGLHVGIIALLPLSLFNLLKIRKKFSMPVVSVILLIYLQITGCPVSLFRACLMFWIFSFQKLIQKTHNIYNTLFLSGVIILLFSPEEVFNLGFHLSFSATAGILLLYKRYKQSFKFLPSKLNESISLTLSAQSFVYPFLLIQLNEINFAGILTNIAAVPATSASFILSLISICFKPNCRISIYIINIYNFLVEYQFKFIEFISQLNLHYHIKDISPILLIIIFINILYPLFTNSKDLKFCISILLINALIFSGAFLSTFPEDNKNGIIVKKGREVFLYNRNEKSTIDPDSVINNLYSCGYVSPILIINGENADTLDRYYTIIKEIPVKKVLLCGKINFNTNLQKILNFCDNEKIETELIEIDKLKEILQSGFELSD